MKGEDWHANRTDDLANPGADRSNPAYDGLNVYGDEVGTVLNFDVLGGLPAGTLARPARNLKPDGKITRGLPECIAFGKAGHADWH